MNQKPAKNENKSDFVGRFGHSDHSETYVKDDGPIGDWRGYPGGAAVVNLRDRISRLFSNGGTVSIAPCSIWLTAARRMVSGLRANARCSCHSR
ncbi:hypothetical protein ACFQX9_36730 [Bradyrhizobium sp. GCM10028915]|uniref:hypothetical protein n=1 Tax=Bradyrhizobium sp. GCM10028915 TaxID=3273385 RepID=UPI00362221CB